MTRRTERVNELLRQELSELISRQVKDPRLAKVVTVTQVETTRDLKHAKVFVSVMGSREEKEATLRGVTSASGYMRRELGARVSLKYVPELSFFLDEALDEAEHIYRLMNDLAAEASTRHHSDSEGSRDQRQ